MKDLSRKCGILEFEKEELEVKYEDMENAKIAMDDQVEEAFAKNRELFKKNEKLLNENTMLKAKIGRAKLK